MRRYLASEVPPRISESTTKGEPSLWMAARTTLDGGHGKLERRWSRSSRPPVLCAVRACLLSQLHSAMPIIIRSTLPSSLLSPKVHDVSADEGVFHEMTKRVLSSTRTTLLTVFSQTQMRMKHHARARILDISPRVRLSVAHVYGHSGTAVMKPLIAQLPLPQT